MYRIVRVIDCPEMKQRAAEWFNSTFNIPIEAYLESMDDCLSGDNAVPQWYNVVDGDRIIAGCGIIANDFHDRPDLTPNLCALYVEKEYRRQGIAGKLLDYVRSDMRNRGIETLYLVTDHDSFYERYGWEFLCMVQGDGEEEMTRMYVHR